MYLKMIFRFLVMVASGMALVLILERFVDMSPIAWYIMGSIWALCFMYWIVSPVFDD